MRRKEIFADTIIEFGNLKTIKISIIGFGVIGSGFVGVLKKKYEFIKSNFNLDLRISAICEFNGSIVNKNGINPDSVLKLDKEKLNMHKNWTSMRSPEVIEKIDSDVVLEVTPGNIKTGEPGLGHIKEALKNGRHVVTSNKAPIALKFSELKNLAERKNLKLMYEATVGGAIPLINLYRETLHINKIESIHGILNGTSNYVLTKMFEEGVNVNSALKEAQELGIAESDPSYDINGIDTAVKIVILANSLMNRNVSFKDVRIKGITDITPEAADLAKKHGYVIKLIGDAEKLEVSPRLIPVNHPLNVSGSLNAIMLNADIAKNITVIGHGAGAEETSSSLFSDILYIAENLE